VTFAQTGQHVTVVTVVTK